MAAVPTVNGLGLSFYATLILRNICVPVTLMLRYQSSGNGYQWSYN